VTGVLVARTRLEPGPDGVRAVATGATERIEAGMVLRAVGYRGLPVPDLPYDAATGTVPSEGGRVRPGVYVAGWVKRGPTGFIGTNKSDAAESVDRLLDDLDAGVLAEPARGPLRRRPGTLDLAGWQAIDAEERRRGAAEGRPRVKLTDVSEMMAVAERASRPWHGRRRRPARAEG